MAHKPYNQEMEFFFCPKDQDNGPQSNLRSMYQGLFFNLESLPNGPEKSVAMRKLLESMDAALRCHHQ